MCATSGAVPPPRVRRAGRTRAGAASARCAAGRPTSASTPPARQPSPSRAASSARYAAACSASRSCRLTVQEHGAAVDPRRLTQPASVNSTRRRSRAQKPPAPAAGGMVHACQGRGADGPGCTGRGRSVSCPPRAGRRGRPHRGRPGGVPPHGGAAPAPGRVRAGAAFVPYALVRDVSGVTGVRPSAGDPSGGSGPAGCSRRSGSGPPRGPRNGPRRWPTRSTTGPGPRHRRRRPHPRWW